MVCTEEALPVTAQTKLAGQKSPAFYNVTQPPAFRCKPFFSIPPALSDHSSLVGAPGRACFSLSFATQGFQGCSESNVFYRTSEASFENQLLLFKTL